MINGHCECGRVRFEVDGEIEDYSHCHCSQCRRMHGAAFATFAGVARSGFRYLSMGAIEGDPPRPPAYHIYVGSKAPWHEIQDDLPQFETEPKVWP